MKSKFNKLITALFCTFLAIIIVASCKKDYHSKDQPSKQELNKLAQWYENNLKVSENNPFSKLKPNWDKVYTSYKDNKIVYEVALENPEKLMVVSNNISKSNLERETNKHSIKLLLFEGKRSHKILYASYMSIEDKGSSDIQNLHYKNFKNLTGNILYHHFNGTSANGWEYANGKAIQKLSTLSQKQVEALKKQAESGKQVNSYQCVMTTAEKYRYGCVGAGSYMNCGYHFVGYETYMKCSYIDDTTPRNEGDDGPNPGETPTGGYEPPLYYDCADVRDGQAYIDPNCKTCIGGTTGIEACTKEVLDSVQNPCLKAQLNLALTAKTTILNMLNSTFGGTIEFEDLSLTFKDVTTLPDSISGDAGRASATSIYFDIRLNKNKLPDYSKEYILSTIYHEILHAYLYSKLTKGADGKYNISTQHEDMANNYLILMTGALKIAFPSISDQEAWALSWGGLEGTNLYDKKLSQAQKNLIGDINRRHTNKSASDKQGTYCTP